MSGPEPGRRPEVGHGSGPGTFPAPLRILQVNSRLTGGGTDDQCLKLTRGLVQLGQSVWLAGPDGRELSGRVREAGIPHLVTPHGRHPRLRFIRAVARYCREHQVQVIHGHHGSDIWPTVLAARWSGVRPRVVLTRHLAKSPASWLSRRFLLSQVDTILAVSHFVAHVLREGDYEPNSPVAERRSRPPLRGDHSRIQVIQGGIDPERFCPRDAEAQRREWGLAPGEVAFGVVGGYDLPRGKGQREFLQAAAMIRDAAPAARFLIVGRGNMEAILRDDIERLGLRGRAWLTPYCHDMPGAMNALDCLVHPQVATDAFPTVILEAMACGRPIVSTRCDGATEQFSDGRHGLLVPMEDVSALAEAMRRLATSSELRERLSAGNREHVLRHFTQSQLAERVLAVYRGLIAGRDRR